MKRKTFSKSDIKQINEELSKYGIEFSKKDSVESVIDDENSYIFSNGIMMVFYHEGMPVPTIKSLLEYDKGLKKITVDMGAIKFVTSGADIMRPGIVEIEDAINVGDAVAIIDVNNKRPLAVGIAMFDSIEMRGMVKGKVVKNIHYVGDAIWNFSFQ